MRRLWLIGLVLGLHAACSGLTKIELGVCGNDVIEPGLGEDCDNAVVEAGTVCQRPGAANACRYTCYENEQGQPTPCPTGWGCGRDGLCRSHAGTMQPVDRLPMPTGSFLELADFDGDGDDDVSWVLSDHIAVAYIDEGTSELAETPVDLLGSIGIPSVGDINTDGITDWLIPNIAGLSALRGSEERQPRPTMFLPIPLSNDIATFIAIDLVPDVVLSGNASEVFSGQESLLLSPGTDTVLSSNDRVTVSPEIAGDVNNLLEPVIVAELDDHVDAAILPAGSPTPEELVIAYPDTPELVVYRPTLSVRLEGNDVWVDVSLSARPPTTVTLPENPKRLIGARHVNVEVQPGLSAITCNAGMNAFQAPGDDHLDLVVQGESGALYVAYGIGDGTFHRDPCELADVPSMIAPSNDVARMNAFDACAETGLAVDHLDSDGALDVVTQDGVWLTSLLGGPEAPGLCASAPAFVVAGGDKWSDAVIADFDGNGIADVIATPRQGGLDFLSGNGSTRLTATHLVGVGPSDRYALAVGDYDANGIADLAIASEVDAELDNVAVIFGEPLAPPSGPIDLGDVDRLFVLSRYDAGDRDAADDLVVGAAKDSRFVGVMQGRSDRFLQLPFVMVYEFPGPGVHVPLGGALGHFASPDQLHVALWGLNTSFTGVPDTDPLLSLGIAEAEGDLKLTLEGALSSVGMHQLDSAGGATATIDVEQDGIDELVVLSAGVLPGGDLRIIVPTLDDAFNWSAAEPLSIPLTGLMAAEPASDPASVVIQGAATRPRVCRLDGDATPSLVVGVVERKSCSDSSALAQQLTTAVLVLNAELLAALKSGQSATLPAEALIHAPEGESIVGVTCLNANADQGEEIAILTVDAPRSTCEAPVDPQSLPADFELKGRVHALPYLDGSAGQPSLLVEIDADDAPSLYDIFADTPPLAGLASGDVNADGVDDIVVGAREHTLVYEGRPVNP